MPSAMILCAGFGTRLRPLTEELPKPLVPVGDESILGSIARQLHAAGFEEAWVNTHHLSEKLRVISKINGLKLNVIHEEMIRGTAGGVAGARPHLTPPVVIWNGDILAEVPVERLLAAAEDGMALGYVPRSGVGGTLGLDAQGGLVRLRGERFGVEVSSGDYVGVAALGADALQRLPDRGCLFGDRLLPDLRTGGTARCVPVANHFTDAGDLAGYLGANQQWLQRHGLSCWVGPGARVSPSVELKRSLVGAGARVDGHGVLENSVIWPGAHASAPLVNAVVTTSGRIVRPGAWGSG